MKIIDVKTSPKYQVKIAAGLMNRLGEEMLAVLGKPCVVAILTDDTVDALYGSRAEEGLKASGFTVYGTFDMYLFVYCLNVIKKDVNKW